MINRSSFMLIRIITKINGLYYICHRPIPVPVSVAVLVGPDYLSLEWMRETYSVSSSPSNHLEGEVNHAGQLITIYLTNGIITDGEHDEDDDDGMVICFNKKDIRQILGKLRNVEFPVHAPGRSFNFSLFGILSPVHSSINGIRL